MNFEVLVANDVMVHARDQMMMFQADALTAMARLVAQSAALQRPIEGTHQKRVKAGKTQHAKKQNGTFCTTIQHEYSSMFVQYASSSLRSTEIRILVHAGALQRTSSTCTFGNGREVSTAADSASQSIIQTANAAAWSQQERAKLNELYCELGRPHCSRGASSVQEHLRLYSIRYRMTYPERTAAEVVARVAHMIKYNQVSSCFCCYNIWLYLNEHVHSATIQFSLSSVLVYECLCA
jgi:hypothetical protein